MKLLVAEIFHVLVASAFSFGFALGLVALLAWMFRVRDPSVRLVMFLLPVAKLGWELARGIPAGAFFWARQSGAKQDLGSFNLGFAVRDWVPAPHLALGAISSGTTYPQSAADLFATALTRRVSSHALLVAVVAMLGVFALLLGRRVARITRAPRDRRTVATRAVGLRTARVLVSDAYQGVPFAGGTLRPWVCFSRYTWDALSTEEREAVLAHELAHLRHHDLLVLSLVALAADLFWFVPFARWLPRILGEQCELRADAAAVRRGTDATILAATLVHVAELVAQAQPAPTLAFVRPGAEPLLARRVARLVEPPRARGRIAGVAVVLGVALVAGMVLRAVTFGNP